MSATTSPIKEKAAGWVKFDEADGVSSAENGPETIGSPAKSAADIVHTSRSSSGVSSARGSVNSAVSPNQDHRDLDNDDGGILAVSEVQVIDERTLKKEQATAALSTVGQGPPTFAQMTIASSETDMDNVNLNDSGSPHKTTDGIRGRRFGRNYLFFSIKCFTFHTL